MNLNIDIKNKEETNIQYAYRVLKENILNLNLYPGQIVSETIISKTLNLSRGTIKNALIQLKNDGLVNIYPQKGTFISYFNENLIREAWFAREILETKVLEIVFYKIQTRDLVILEKIINFQKIILDFESTPLEFFNSDNEFHEYLYTIADKKSIWNLFRSSFIHLNRLRLLDAKQGERIETIIKEHEIILKLLKEKDFNKIQSIIKIHLNDYERQIQNTKTNFPHYFESIPLEFLNN